MSPDPKDITIAITVYNRRDFVLGAIESALGQSLSVNVIVVEDCGPDPTLRDFILGRFGDRVNYYRNPKNRGLCDNWNACMEYCRTPWISILHDDDELNPCFVQSMLDLMRAVPSRMLYFGREATRHERGEVCPATPVSWTGWREVDLVELANSNVVMFPGHLFRVKDAKAVGGVRPNDRFTADWDLWFRLAARGGGAQTETQVAIRRCFGLERGTSRVERMGRKWALRNVQRKRNLALLRRERGITIPFERTNCGSPIQPRTLLRDAEQFPPRLLAYNAWLLVHSAPPHLRYALFQWVVRLFGARSLRGCSVLWKRLCS